MLSKNQRGIIHLGIIGLVVLTVGLFAASKLASNPDLTFFNISEEAAGIEEASCKGCDGRHELRWVKRKDKKTKKVSGVCTSRVSRKCDENLSTKETQKPESNKVEKCVVAGCNSDLCIDESQKNIATTCALNPSKSCYLTAKCEKQSDGKCGWTQTAGLKSCLEIPLCGTGLYCKGQTSGIEGATRCRDKDWGTIISCCPSGQKIVDSKCQ